MSHSNSVNTMRLSPEVLLVLTILNTISMVLTVLSLALMVIFRRKDDPFISLNLVVSVFLFHLIKLMGPLIGYDVLSYSGSLCRAQGSIQFYLLQCSAFWIAAYAVDFVHQLNSSNPRAKFVISVVNILVCWVSPLILVIIFNALGGTMVIQGNGCWISPKSFPQIWLFYGPLGLAFLYISYLEVRLLVTIAHHVRRKKVVIYLLQHIIGSIVALFVSLAGILEDLVFSDELEIITILHELGLALLGIIAFFVFGFTIRHCNECTHRNVIE